MLQPVFGRKGSSRERGSAHGTPVVRVSIQLFANVTTQRQHLRLFQLGVQSQLSDPPPVQDCQHGKQLYLTTNAAGALSGGFP